MTELEEYRRAVGAWRTRLLDAWAHNHRATMTALLEDGPLIPAHASVERPTGTTLAAAAQASGTPFEQPHVDGPTLIACPTCRTLHELGKCPTLPTPALPEPVAPEPRHKPLRCYVGLHHDVLVGIATLAIPKAGPYDTRTETQRQHRFKRFVCALCGHESRELGE